MGKCANKKKKTVHISVQYSPLTQCPRLPLPRVDSSRLLRKQAQSHTCKPPRTHALPTLVIPAHLARQHSRRKPRRKHVAREQQRQPDRPFSALAPGQDLQFRKAASR